MGTPLAGIGGLVKSAGVTVANLGIWSIAAKAASSDTTPFQATGNWETKLATVKSWTAKADGRADPADTTGQLTLINGLGSTFAVEFDLDAGAAHKWTGNAILTGIDPKADAKGLIDISFSFDGTAALAFT